MIEDTQNLFINELDNNTIDNPEIFGNSESAVLQVTNFAFDASSFTIDFNRAIDNSVIDYSVDDLEADLLVQDASGNSISGSIVFNDDFSSLTFVKTGDSLEAGDYTVNLRSDENGFNHADGGLLDGNSDGIEGDDYTIEFTIENSERIISLSDLILSPGEAVEDEQLLISINDGTDITSLTLDLEYNPDFLDIDSIEIVEDLAIDWDVETDFSSPGVASITLTGQALASGEQNLIQISGNVSETATYGASQLLKLNNALLNNGEISSLEDTAIQQVSLLGDVSRNQTHEAEDAYLIAQLNTGLISNFTEYPGIDPNLVADINGDGVVSAFDAYNIDYLPPTVTANLTEDTGLSNEDKITTNPQITGNFLDNIAIKKLEGGFGDNLTDITDLVQSDGSFTLSSERLAQLNSEDTLSDGEYTISLVGTDASGNKSGTAVLSFTLDTQSPEISEISHPIGTNDPNRTSVLDSIINDEEKITGRVDATGSSIAEATYRFNDNSTVVLPVDQDGNFDLELDLTEVQNSFSSLEVAFTDLAGNSTSREINVIIPIITDSTLQYADDTVGSGASPSVGDLVTVNYTGFLEDGSVFDSSLETGRSPFSFNLGVGQVIAGWDEGVASMNIGGSRLLIIPPELGYGERGIPGTIPPNATLFFNVDLLSIG